MLGLSIALLLGFACAPRADDRAPAGEASAAARRAGFVQPAGTVAVSFRVDDRENRVYGDGDLAWKGSFLYDPATRILSFDPSWSGGLPGWPALYDDGPGTSGGHEPAGAQPGDHVWGVTVFVAPPASGATVFAYGLVDATYEATFGNGWIWPGQNGSFAVAAGATLPVDAPGIRFDKWGKSDLRLVIDTNHLAQLVGWTWDTSFVAVRSSWWGWGTFAMTDQGGGVYALDLAALLDAGTLPHTGLLKKGAAVEFVFQLGPNPWDEYKAWYTDGTNWWSVALTDGVAAELRCNQGMGFVKQPIAIAANGNTVVTTPACGFPGGDR